MSAFDILDRSQIFRPIKNLFKKVSDENTLRISQLLLLAANVGVLTPAFACFAIGQYSPFIGLGGPMKGAMLVETALLGGAILVEDYLVKKTPESGRPDMRSIFKVVNIGGAGVAVAAAVLNAHMLVPH